MTFNPLAGERQPVKDIEGDVSAEDFQWLMSTTRGRRIVHGVLANSGVFATRLGGTPEETYFHLGGRDVGLRVLSMIQRHCLPQFQVMLNEAKDFENQLKAAKGGTHE